MNNGVYKCNWHLKLNVDTISHIVSYLNFYEIYDTLLISKTWYKACSFGKLKEYKILYNIYTILFNNALKMDNGRESLVFNYKEIIKKWDNYKVFECRIYFCKILLTEDKIIKYKNLKTMIKKNLEKIKEKRKGRKRKVILHFGNFPKYDEIRYISW